MAKDDADVLGIFDRRVTGSGAPQDLPFVIMFETRIEIAPSDWSAAGSAARSSQQDFNDWLYNSGDTARWNAYNARTADEKAAAREWAKKL